MCKQEYEIVLCRKSKDIEKNFKAETYQVFVCDDIFGEYTINRREANRWSTQLTRDYITNILCRGKSKLVLSVKNQVFQESLFSQLNYLKFAEIDMSVVTLDQKCAIAKQLLQIDEEANSAFIDNFRKNGILLDIEFAPLTFTLCKSNINIPLFFEDPIETYCKELNALQNVEDKSKLCALFLLIVHNGYMDENYFSAHQTLDERNLIESIFKEFAISKTIPTSSMEDHLKVFEGRLIVKERGIFRPKHQIYFNCLCSFFGDDSQKMQKLFIKCAHSQVISRRTAFSSLQLNDVPRFTVLITPNNEQIYFERMVEDICHGSIWDTLENDQLHKSTTFRLRFLKYLKVLPEDKQRHIVNSFDHRGSCSPVSILYVAVYHGLMHLATYILQISSAQLMDSQDKFPPLIAACERGHKCIVNLLIECKADVNQMDDFGRRPLIVAVQNDHSSVAEVLINKNADINLGDRNGWTPFMWACVLNRNEVAKLLMEHCADVNQASNDGSTPLFWCSIMGLESFVILLHAKGSKGSLSTPNCNGKTPLMAASYFRRQEIVTYLLQHLESVDETDNEGWTPLMEACFDNDNGSWNTFLDQFNQGKGLWFPLLKLVSEMEKYCDDSVGYNSIIDQLLSKSNIDHQDNDGKSALHHACEGQYNRIVNILTERGANVNLEDTNKSTAIMEACFIEDEDTVLPLMETPAGPCRPIIEQLLSKGANINSTDKEGWNPFCYNCETGNSNMVHRLIEFTNDVNTTYKNGKTPLQMAQKCGNNEIICLLKQKGAHQNTIENESHDIQFDTLSSVESISYSSDSETESLPDAKKDVGRLLLQACRHRDEDRFPSLLEEAASENILNISGKKGKTPLMEACRYKDTGKVKLLLEAGASVNKDDMNCWTPLLETCKVGDIEMVQLLLENKAEINKSDDRGYSPLFIASTNGSKDIVELLLSHRADVNIANNAGITPLLATCTKEYIDIVQLLIDRGANINQPDAYGNTSLMIAGFYGYNKILKLLLSKKANIDQKDSKGWTAFSWATKGGNANTFVKMAYIHSLPDCQTGDNHAEKQA
ncbi:ankyrin repeat domain-containing protein 50-like [Mytilus trossulus]|uniref:ankyrin repeat domain-containing protein 50-like n=1 Tax=Mytilus trossulus TaxID=6551 RepID=UPI0030043459